MRDDPTLGDALRDYALLLLEVVRGREVAALTAAGNIIGAAAVAASKYVPESLLFSIWQDERARDYRLIKPMFKVLLTPANGSPSVEEALDHATPKEVDDIANFFDANKVSAREKLKESAKSSPSSTASAEVEATPSTGDHLSPGSITSSTAGTSSVPATVSEP